MSFIIGKYYGGDPRVKPDQWGPAADVQAAIRENAARMGIDPASIVLYMPMWEGAGLKALDYIRGTSGILTNSPTWTSGGVQFTSTAHIALPSGTGNLISSRGSVFCCWDNNGDSSNGSFFDTRIGGNTGWDIKIGLVTANYLGLTVDTNSSADLGEVTIEENISTLPASDQTFVATYDGATISLHISGLASISAPQSGSAYESTTSKIGNQANNAAPIGANRNIKLFSIFDSVLTDSQIADLSDNPYTLTQCIVRRFYSIPEGAGDVIAAACTDGFTFADSATKTAILQATAIESINLSDSDENVAQFIAALVDSFTMADLPGNTAKYPVSVSDAFSVSDSTTALQKVIALVSDNVTFSDVSVVRADLTGIAEDNVTFAETLIANLHAQAIASEIINLSDSVNAELLGDLLAYVTETFNMSDSPTARADLVVLITDAFDLSDAATNTLQAYATATDGFTVSDTAFWAGVTQAIASDSFTVSGSVTGLIKLLAQAAETINFSDSGSVTATYNVQVNDAVEFATAISTIAQLRAAVSDGFNVTATPMEVSQLPNGKVSVSFSMKTATVVFNIK